MVINKRRSIHFMQLNCVIPKTLHSQIKGISFLDGKQINETVEEALKNWLELRVRLEKEKMKKDVQQG